MDRERQSSRAPSASRGSVYTHTRDEQSVLYPPEHSNGHAPLLLSVHKVFGNQFTNPETDRTEMTRENTDPHVNMSHCRSGEHCNYHSVRVCGADFRRARCHSRHIQALEERKKGLHDEQTHFNKQLNLFFPPDMFHRCPLA